MPIEDKLKIEIWHRAIETQMHFAELSLKMRQIGLTLVGATVAFAIVMYRTDYAFSVPLPWTEAHVPAATILFCTAAAILFGVRTIDVGVYHRMLRGAVKFNENYEKKIASEVEWDSGLTQTISAYSRLKDPVFENGEWVSNKKRRCNNPGKKNMETPQNRE